MDKQYTNTKLCHQTSHLGIRKLAFPKTDLCQKSKNSTQVHIT